MMPKRIAETDPFQQIPEPIGSGPFRFVKSEFAPGTKVVYEKFKDYVPRGEPASSLAGGKQVLVDRVEWLSMPDAQTAMSAAARRGSASRPATCPRACRRSRRYGRETAAYRTPADWSRSCAA